MEYLNPYGVKIANIRSTQHNKQTHYSVVDVWKAVDPNEGKRCPYYSFKSRNSWLKNFVVKLEIPSRSLNQDATDCANAEGILLIISLIDSPKAQVIRQAMSKALSDKLKQAKGTSLVKFIESIE